MTWEGLNGCSLRGCRPRCYRVAARFAGLVVFLYGLEHLLYGILGAAGMFETKVISYNGVFGVCEVVTGLFMMRGMIPLVDIAFLLDRPSSDETQIQKHGDEKDMF